MYRDPDTGRFLSTYTALRRNAIEVFHMTAAEFVAAWKAGDGSWMAHLLEERVNEAAPAEDDCEPADMATHLLSTCPGRQTECGASGMMHADINFVTCYECQRTHAAHQEAQDLAGFYWWSCVPGCLPDSDAFGPFETEKEAADNALDDCY